MRIKWLILIAVLTGTVAFWGCGGSNATGPTGGSEIEGLWSYSWTDATFNFTFSGTNFNYEQLWYTTPPETLVWSGTFTSNPAATPKTIDYLCSSSPDTIDIGKTALGIYMLNSTATQITLEFRDFGDTQRPTTFGTGALILDKQ